MKLAFVMDPISQISYKKDSTLAMMVEAQEKGHEIFYIEPDCLFFNSDNLVQNFLLFQLTMKNQACMRKEKITSRL